ncbi:uncharacterized protein LOC134831753 [Culicoides brevitarsis]|uniref:uncharacterized protein LOC134831753 n=1 Tax=Culicoides brevitarsis TaxID=469753 RepID=UPI00307BAFD8
MPEKPVCRACLKTSFRLKKVTNVDKKLSMTIQTSYSLLTGINCAENDQICPKCLKMLVKCSKFIEKCEEADAKLLQEAMNSDTDFFDDSTTTEEVTEEPTDQSCEEPQTQNIEEEISSLCSEAGSTEETSKVMETEVTVHSASSKSVKFHENLEEVYESDFEECSSETESSKVPQKMTKWKRKRPRIVRRAQKDDSLFHFCKVCRRTFPDRFTLQMHLNGTSVYIPGNHAFFDF